MTTKKTSRRWPPDCSDAACTGWHCVDCLVHVAADDMSYLCAACLKAARRVFAEEMAR